MKVNKEKFFSAASAVISALLTAQAFSYPYESSQFPRFLCLLMLLFSFIILAKNFKNKSAEHKEIDTESLLKSAKIPAAVFGSVVAYVICMSYIGYFVSTAAFMALTMIWFGERRVVPIISAIAVFLIVVYALFIAFLGLRLPEGLLF